jgi:hypothetical protein
MKVTLKTRKNELAITKFRSLQAKPFVIKASLVDFMKNK